MDTTSLLEVSFATQCYVNESDIILAQFFNGRQYPPKDWPCGSPALLLHALAMLYIAQGAEYGGVMPKHLVVIVLLGIGLTPLLSAQTINPSQLRRLQQWGRQTNAPQSIDLEGTLVGVSRGTLMLVDGNNHTWRVVVPTEASVRVTGETSVDALQTGTVVEFQAQIDQRGAIDGKIDAMSVVSLSGERQAGLFPVESADEKKTDKPARRGATPPGEYRVVGPLVVGRNGKFSVRVAGRGLMAFAGADQAAVKIDSSDYSLASRGDKVSVKGVGMLRGQAGMAQAASVNIELCLPLGGADKKTTSHKSPKQPAKRAGDKGLPEPPEN